MFWVFFFGLVLFLPRLLIFLWDFFKLSPSGPAEPPNEELSLAPEGET